MKHVLSARGHSGVPAVYAGLLALAVLLLPRSAAAVGFEPGNLTFGISGAYNYVGAQDTGSMLGYEITGSIEIEPYYRPRISINSATVTSNTDAAPQWTHEVGIMLKLTTTKFRWPWHNDQQPAVAPRM